jgi:hypothetical protein
MKSFFPFSLSTAFFMESLSATTFLYEPSPYFGASDSPFYGGIVDNTGQGIFLETFEDNELNTPFVQTNNNGTFIGTTFRTRSPAAEDRFIFGVDEDNGLIDGNGFGGDTWLTIDRRTNGVSGMMEFIFSPDNQGRLPFYVGFVVTSVLDVDRDVDVGFRDVNGNLLESDAEFEPEEWGLDPVSGRPFEGLFRGDPRTHRFIGLYSDEGIVNLRIQNVFQLDHLQYGYSIPEPTVCSFFALAVGGGFLRRKRARSSSSPKEWNGTPKMG